MPEHNHLEMSVPWVEVTVTESDWDAASPQLLTSAFAQLSLIRAFEEFVLGLAADGLIHGPAHSSIRKAAPSAPCSRCAPAIRSTARTAVTTSSWPRRWPT
jgi:hypothetical protein